MHVVISKITTEKDRDRIYNFKTRWEKQIDKKCFITQKQTRNKRKKKHK